MSSRVCRPVPSQQEIVWLSLFLVLGCGPTKELDPAAEGSPVDAETGLADAADGDAGADARAATEPATAAVGVCTVRPLPTHTDCDGVPSCWLRFSGELTCGGSGGQLELVATDQLMFAKLAFADSQRVMAWAPDTTSFQDVATLTANRAWLRRRATDQVALLVPVDQALEVYALSGSEIAGEAAPAPHKLDRLALPGAPLDAAYDDTSALSAFSVRIGEEGEASTLFRSPGDGSTTLDGVLHAQRALQLADGSIGLALVISQASSNARSVTLWATAQGLSEQQQLPADELRWLPGALEPPRPVTYSFAASGQGMVMLQNDSSAMWLVRAMENAQAVVSYPRSSCTGQELAYYPKYCSSQNDTRQAGERIVSHELVPTSTGQPMVLTVAGSASESCSWRAVNQCIESQTCDCRQLSSLRVSATQLRVRSATKPGTTQSFSVGAPDGMAVSLALAPARSDGIVVAASVWLEPKPAGATITHVRYWGLLVE